MSTGAANPVLQAFLDQVRYCESLGSAFTARVCRVCAERLGRDIPVAATILDWPGDPSAFGDSVPLRLAGALHGLARSGKAPALRAAYPPAKAGDDELWSAIRGALVEHEQAIRSYLASAPQTNEVMRSAALLPGLLEVARRTKFPIVLYEVGASAGLNLILDRYRFRFGTVTWGAANAPLLLEPRWEGAPPPVRAALKIAARQGVDLNPIDLAHAPSRERILSYVWPDQFDRLERLRQAISAWLAEPQRIDRGDAANWLEASSIREPQAGVTRVLFHSVAWSYFPEETRQRITFLMQSLGDRADVTAPLAWLRYEMTVKQSELRLTVWPGGEDRLLAIGHPHGSEIHWRGAD